MKTTIKRSLFIVISLALAGLTARRFRHEHEIDAGTDDPAPPLPEPDSKPASVLPQAPDPPSSPLMSAAELADALALPLAAAPTVTFSGTVVRSGAHFALRETAGVLYPLDLAGRARPFEGEDVRVTGKLDLNTRRLYVDAIERSMPSVA